MNFFRVLHKLALGVSVLLLLLAVTASAADRDRCVPATGETYNMPPPSSKGVDRATVYQGYLRIFVVEPVSRHTDASHIPYDFGLLGLALNQGITLHYRDTISQSITWNAGELAPIDGHNLMVLAVVYNGEGHQAYSYPPQGPFTAHWVDAAAAALPGEMGIDSSAGLFTHTVVLDFETVHT